MKNTTHPKMTVSLQQDGPVLGRFKVFIGLGFQLKDGKEACITDCLHVLCLEEFVKYFRDSICSECLFLTTVQKECAEKDSVVCKAAFCDSAVLCILLLLSVSNKKVYPDYFLYTGM